MSHPPGRRPCDRFWRALTRCGRRLTTGESVPNTHLSPNQLASDERPPLDDKQPVLGLHKRRQDPVTVARFACEQPWTPEVAAQPCPGDPAVNDLHTNGPGLIAWSSSASAATTRAREGADATFTRCHGAT
jgi:hypothetical protein